jgi:virginiamycin B lyase
MPRRALALLASLTLALGLLAVAPGLAAPASAATQVIPVPTSAAGLGRIVTAPDGAMWFIEKDANKVGRITPGGQITEFDLGARTTADSTVKDVAVAADGTVWVAYDSGWRVKAIDAAGQTVRGPYVFDYPYAEQIAIAGDGTPWVTMNYDEDFVVRIVGDQALRSSNAPQCQEALARAVDGAMWCRTESGLTRLNGDASGGVTYPANNDAAYPYAIAAGPVGSIWFGRYFGGTMFTSPDDGEVGYLDAATGAVTAFNTGERTAPADLVPGPDGSMWFTSIGAAAGIGHISAQGRGALTAIGGYEPEHLTFAPDGAIFATDPTNNVILRLTTDQLQQTNVDPGAGSVFTQGGGQPPAPPVVGKLAKPRKPVAVRHGKVPMQVVCPAGGPACRGALTLRTVTEKHRAVTRAAAYTVQPGTKRTIRLALTKAGKKTVRPGRVTKLRAELTATGAKTVRVVVKVRR